MIYEHRTLQNYLLCYLIFDCILIQLSNAGGRIIIASDGVWDDLTCEMALDCSRGFPSDIAANRIVNVIITMSSFNLNNSVFQLVISSLLLSRKQSGLEE